MRSKFRAIPRYESAARHVKPGYPHWRIEVYSGFPGARAGVDFHRGYTGKHWPKEYIERGQIYFGFEVDEKLLPFAIEEFGDQCWVYGSETIKIWLQVPAAEISQNVMIESRELGKASGRLTGA